MIGLKHSDLFIVIFTLIVISSSREKIPFNILFIGFMVKCEVIIGEFSNLLGLLAIEFLRLLEVTQILVISSDLI